MPIDSPQVSLRHLWRAAHLRGASLGHAPALDALRCAVLCDLARKRTGSSKINLEQIGENKFTSPAMKHHH